jgi:hypothetical protein
MSALRKLIEAVEAGWFAMDVLPPVREIEAYDAFYGSLDAALRLHNALLPGWHWRGDDGQGQEDAFVRVWHPDGRKLGMGEGECEPPARAWLLAVLRALQAKEANNE